MCPRTVSQYSSCTSRSSMRRSVDPPEISRTMTRMTRFGQCAITTCSDGVRALPSLPSLAIRNHKQECLVAFPIPIIRNSQHIEDVSLKEQETITFQIMPRNRHKELTISTSLFRCFGSLDPTQVSSRPCANQYILSNAALLKDPTCAQSRENLFHSRASSINLSWRNEATLSCMHCEPSIGAGGG